MARHPIARLRLVLLLVSLAVLPAGCGDDGPSRPPGVDGEHLAGGGRKSDDDPFVGGADGSGPSLPDFPEPGQGYLPLFFSEVDCQNTPSERVITNDEDWQAGRTG